MSDERALLAAIWEHPHEDTPRLMYADWLQENGQPERAEFIRVQCELAQFGEWDDSPRKAELEKREKSLWTKHAKVWKTGLPPDLQKRAGFHRGFPTPPPREMPSSKFLKLTTDDFAHTPLWNYHLPPNHKLLTKLLDSPLLRRIGTLDFRHWLESPDDMKRFSESPNVRNVANLNVGVSGFGDRGILALAANAGNLPHLRQLDLAGNDLTTHAMKALTASPLVDGLRDLNLFGNPIGAEGVLALANAPRLARLERLDLGYIERDKQIITREAVTALFASPHLKSLARLTLDPPHFGDKGVQAICSTQPVFQLAEFGLMSVLDRIGDSGAEALAAWPGLANVRKLYLHANAIGPAGAMALARSTMLGKVTELWLHVNPLCADAAAVTALRARFGEAVRI